MNRKRFFKKFRRRLRKKRKIISEKIKNIRFKCYRIWRKNRIFFVFLFLYVSIMVNSLLVRSKLFSSPPIKIEKKQAPKHVPYSEFLRGVKKNEIIKAGIDPNNDIVYFEEKNGTISSSYYVPSEDFWQTMKESEVIYDIERLPNPNINELISFIFIMILLFCFFYVPFS